MALLNDLGLFEPPLRDNVTRNKVETRIQKRIQSRLYRNRIRIGKSILEYTEGGCGLDQAVHFALLDSKLTKTAAYRYDVYVNSLVNKNGGEELFFERLRYELDSINDSNKSANINSLLGGLIVIIFFVLAGQAMNHWGVVVGAISFVLASFLSIAPVSNAIIAIRRRDETLNNYAGSKKFPTGDNRIVKSLSLSREADKHYQTI